MVARSGKRIRTSVILTEAQFRSVQAIAQANDASIAWVLRQAVDRYLQENHGSRRGFNRQPTPTEIAPRRHTARRDANRYQRSARRL